MKGGDAFKFADPAIDDHLWVVLSDPRQNRREVLVVSITTWHAAVRDTSCIIKPGEHPLITVTSCVYYDDTRVIAEADLAADISDGSLRLCEPFASDVLRRMRDGAAVTEFLTPEQAAILDAQEF